jgi:enolase
MMMLPCTWAVAPSGSSCSSRGEGAGIADYCVGINAGTVREGAIGPTGNRFLQIETELSKQAKFLGAKGFKSRRLQK